MSGTTKRWLGVAAPVNDVWTISLSGTVTSQTYSMTINNKSVTYTSTGGDTVFTILGSLYLQWGLSQITEFLELTAVPLPGGGPFTTLQLTGTVAGVPSVISVSTSGAATFTITNSTPATGPNDFTNAANWSNDIAPTNSDTLVFDNGNIACLYGLGSTLTGITLEINPGYSGQIGLPLINQTGQSSYSEYRTTSLTLAGGTAIINSPTIRQCNLAFGANTTTVRVLSTGTRLNTYIPVLLLTGGNGSSELDISKGDVATAFYIGTTANFPTIKTGYVSNPLTDVSLNCGAGTTLGTIIKNGGNVIVSAAATTITQDVSGGSLTITDAAAITTLNVYGGTVAQNSIGTLGTLNLYASGSVSFDGDPRAKTVTTLNVFAQTVSVTDSAKTVNSGVLTLAMNGNPSCSVFHGGNSSIVLT